MLFYIHILILIMKWHEEKVSQIHFTSYLNVHDMSTNYENKLNKGSFRKGTHYSRAQYFIYLSLLSCFHNWNAIWRKGCKWLTVNTFIVEPEIDCWGFEIFSENNLKTTIWNEIFILIQMRFHYYTQVYLWDIKPVSI